MMKFNYTETKGGDKVLLLLHGLLGGLSNFEKLINHFGKRMNVVIPVLPILESDTKELGLEVLLKFVEDFVSYKGFEKVSVLGNSLGGHLAQLFVLNNPDKVDSLILTGSSGLFESAMGNTFPKRGDYEYIKNKAQETFYDPATATKELVDEMFAIVNDRVKALRIVVTAKSAIRHNLENKLHAINTPTLLIWGAQDKVTPPFVAEKFNELITGSKLCFIDKCGHAPMMERPEDFNKELEIFLHANNIISN